MLVDIILIWCLCARLQVAPKGNMRNKLIARRNPNKKAVMVAGEDIVNEAAVRANSKQIYELVMSRRSAAEKEAELLAVTRLVPNVPGSINLVYACADMRLLLKILAEKLEDECMTENELVVLCADFFIRPCCGVYDAESKQVGWAAGWQQSYMFVLTYLLRTQLTWALRPWWLLLLLHHTEGTTSGVILYAT